jgi:outer membrane lipoprotein-sorting protein
MKYLFLSSLVFLSMSFAFSQVELNKDPKAKKVLDALAKKTKSYNSLRIKFDYLVENKQNGLKENHTGYAFLQAKKYKIIIPGTEIFSDGKTVWTYMKESNEITITEPGPDEESIFNPAKLFTIYETGYKYLLIGEEQTEKKIFNVIDLFPEKSSESPYSKIRIRVDKIENEIYSVETYGKSGLNHFLTVSEIKPDIIISEQLFIFDEKKFPKGIEIIDMRF